MGFPWSNDDEQPLDSGNPDQSGFCAWILIFPFIGIAISAMLIKIIV